MGLQCLRKSFLPEANFNMTISCVTEGMHLLILRGVELHGLVIF